MTYLSTPIKSGKYEYIIRLSTKNQEPEIHIIERDNKEYSELYKITDTKKLKNFPEEIQAKVLELNHAYRTGYDDLMYWFRSTDLSL